MRNWLPVMALAFVTSLSLAPTVADAKRFGGGGSSGIQRSLPAQAPARPAAPAPQQAAPATTPGAAPAAAASPARNWMGPIAGLAAGLGLAALMSHLGLGEAFGSFLLLALIAVAGVVLFRMLMSRRATPAAAGAAPGWTPTPAPAPAAGAPMARTSTPAVPSAAGTSAEWSADGSTRLAAFGSKAPALPAGFDAEGFARIARMIFIRMQAANDAGDLNDLRSFTTPEMFAVARVDIQDRAGKSQTTDVVEVDAEVLDFEQAGDRQIVSVRYRGKIREEAEGPAAAFDEVWHLQRWGDDADWKIAGIQQMPAAVAA